MLECSSRSLNIQLTYVNYLKDICESEFDLRESPDWLSQKKEGKPGTCRRTVPFLAHVVICICISLRKSFRKSQNSHYFV